MLPETTKPPRRAVERARGRPRALLNDDDGGQLGAGAGEGDRGGGAHRDLFNRFTALASTQKRAFGAGTHATAVHIAVNEHTCAGDERRNPGGNRKVLGTTLGIRKYLLTWCFAWSKLRLVPESACQPELKHRPGRDSRKVDPDGTRAPVHVGESGSGRDEKPGPSRTGQPGNRVQRRHGRNRKRRTSPNWRPASRFHGAEPRAPGNRGRRNGDVFGNGPGNRKPGRKAASPAEPSGATGDVNSSSERLTPADRSVVDRPTFGPPRVGAPASAERASRGAHRFPDRCCFARACRTVRCSSRRTRTADTHVGRAIR
jgi:hypothetical protein